MLADIYDYEVVNPALWQGRIDSLPGERFFQKVQCVDIRTCELKNSTEQIILGFCSDEGVRRNHGRTGAKWGPNELREQLAKLACHTDSQFFDGGNIICAHHELESAQHQFAQLIQHCHQHQHKTLAFGGGHEIAWAHFNGLAPHYPKMGIINFDAHFDIRPIGIDEQGTSGTPFWQIQQYCEQNNRSFNYCCVGIQAIANTKSLFERAHDWHIPYLTATQMNEKTTAWQLSFLNDFINQHDHIYLSICLDVFAECFAPGVSAPQAAGIDPRQALPLLKYIAQSGKVVSIDIAELSPPLDANKQTSRLGAALIAELLNLN